MKKKGDYLSGLAILTLLIFCAMIPQSGAVTIDTTALTRAYLKNQLSGARGIEAEDPELRQLYANRNYQPIWTNQTSVKPEAYLLLDLLAASRSHGLNPESYQLPEIRESFQNSDVVARAELDLMLSRALQDYSEDLWFGTLTPEEVDSRWFLPQERRSIFPLLEQALVEGSFADLIKYIEPQQPDYNNLRLALAYYQELQEKGGWPYIMLEGAPPVHGQQHPIIPLLRIRLALSEDYRSPFKDSDKFDDDLVAAIRHFQDRHGLKADGKINSATLAAMNVPVSQRIQQILVNMERWRWQNIQGKARYILVNLAAFTLDFIEDQQAVMSMKVIVGKTYRSTPAFSQEMTHMILNPYWNVPTSIAMRDVLPRIRRDPNYLGRQNIRLYSKNDEQKVEVDPSHIDWVNLDQVNFPYRLRQDPGPHNALGRIKFVLPNKFSIYLHDTPQRHLFHKQVRTFSSGCVRLEKPLELARHILGDEPGWDDGRINGLLENQGRKVIKLQQPLPVHIIYRTAWVNQKQVLNFREDVYDRNTLLSKALFDSPSSS